MVCVFLVLMFAISSRKYRFPRSTYSVLGQQLFRNPLRRMGELSKRAPKADENIRSIRPDLAKAVDECIEAAGMEWEAILAKKASQCSSFNNNDIKTQLNQVVNLVL